MSLDVRESNGMCHGRFPTDVPCTFPDLYLYWDNSTGWLVPFFGIADAGFEKINHWSGFFSIIPLERLCGTLFYGGGFALVFCFIWLHWFHGRCWSDFPWFPGSCGSSESFASSGSWRTGPWWFWIRWNLSSEHWSCLVSHWKSFSRSADPAKSSPMIGFLYNGYGYHSRGMENPNFCWEKEPAELYESVVHPGLNF